jgi:hypothetical protein
MLKGGVRSCIDADVPRAVVSECDEAVEIEKVMHHMWSCHYQQVAVWSLTTSSSDEARAAGGLATHM